jgi:hypothetical protein
MAMKKVRPLPPAEKTRVTAYLPNDMYWAIKRRASELECDVSRYIHDLVEADISKSHPLTGERIPKV